MSIPEAILKAAHAHCAMHESEIVRSTVCGCFYCLETFPSAEVEDWVGAPATAICPRCMIDSVIGDASGYPVGDPEFLRAMRRYWFEQTVTLDPAKP